MAQSKKNLAAFLFLTLFGTFALADVSGKWQGYGQWNYDGSAVPCVLTIHFVETETSLQRLGGELACDLLTMYSDPLTWNKDGSGLVLNGTPAGSWDVNGFRSKELANDEVEVETDFNKLTGQYQESWRKITDGALIYKINATLLKK